MATKATLENLVIAQKAQLDALAAQMAALTTQAPKAAAEAKPAKPAVPLVALGYFKREDPATGKWLDDATRPCVIVTLPDGPDGKKAKPRKSTRANFERELTLHAKMAADYKALA